MSLRGTALAIVAMLILAGCSAPPISEDAFTRRMESLEGVTWAYVTSQQPLPFMYNHKAHIQVADDLTEVQLRAILAELDSMPDFNQYDLTEDTDTAARVSWANNELPTGRSADFLAVMWPGAAALPPGTKVDFHLEAWSATRVSSHDAGPTEPEDIAVAATTFIALFARTDNSALLDLYLPDFSFEGVPGDCPDSAKAVEAVIEAADVTSIRVACEGTQKRIAVSVLDDPADVEARLESDGRAADFDITVTPDEFRVDPEVSSELLADVTAVAAAAREVPGVPSAHTTDSGIEFDRTDEATVRALLEVLQPLPEFDRITFKIYVQDTDGVYSIGKAPGHPIYLDQIIATAKHPAVTRTLAEVGADEPVEYDIVVHAESVEDVATILRGTGLHQAVGVQLRVLASRGDERLVRITVVVQSDGTLVPVYEQDDASEQQFLDAWNSA